MKTVEHNGHKLIFKERKHSYVMDDEINMKSVTTLIHEWFPEFDADAVAKKVAGKGKYENMSVEEIKEAWKKEGSMSAALGTSVHSFAEYYLKGEGDEYLKKISKSWLKRDNLIKELQEFMPNLLSEYEFIEAEKIIFSPKYRLSGTIDVLMRNKKTGSILIGDWKTNKEIKKSNYFEKGLGKLDFLDNCNYKHYALQLSLYQEMLEDEEYFPADTRYEKKLFHITTKGVVEYPIEEFRKAVEIILDARLAEIELEKIEEKSKIF